jgi:hypothetical protein
MTTTRYLLTAFLIFCITLAAWHVAMAVPPGQRITVDMNNLERKQTVGPLFSGRTGRVSFHLKEAGVKFTNTSYYVSLHFGTNGATSASSTTVNGSALSTNGIGTIDFTPSILTTNADYYYNLLLTNSSELIVIGEGLMIVRPSL